MAKYESPWQILGLFLGASLVAIGVIFVLNVEANKRYGTEKIHNDVSRSLEDTEKNSEDFSLAKRISDKLRRLRSWFTFHGDEDGEKRGGPRRKRSINHNEEQFASQLGENLLTESLNGHKLRNVKGKVALLDPRHDQIVAEILKQFCVKENCSSTVEKNPPVKEHRTFPILDNHEEEFPGENKTTVRLQFKEGSGVVDHDVLVCENYGNTISTVLITTVVNVTFIGLIMLFRQLSNACSSQDILDDDFSSNSCCKPSGQTGLDGEFYDDDAYGFAIQGVTDTPIIKTSLGPAERRKQ